MRLRFLCHTLLLFSAAALIVQCTKKDATMVGTDFFDRDNRGTEHHAAFYPAAADTFFQEPHIGGSSSSLFAGKTGDLETRTLFRWQEDALPSTGTIDTARFTLFFARAHGDTAGFTRPKLHVITSGWDEETVTWGEFEANNLLGDEIDVKDYTSTSESITFTLPESLIQSWVDSTTAADNFGFCLSFSEPDTGFILQFHSEESSESSLRPMMEIHSRVDTTRLNFFLGSSFDAYIARQEISGDPQRLYISSCSAYRSYLYFDLDSLPANASINLAMLNMKIDTLLSWPDNTTAFPLIASALEETFHLPPDLQTGNDLVQSSVVTPDSLMLNVSQFIQSWTLGESPNHGLLLLSMYEDQNIGKRAFFSSAADSLLMPRLDIYYSLPPSDRF